MEENWILYFLLFGALALNIVWGYMFVFYNFTIKNWQETQGIILWQGPVSDNDGGWQAKIIYEYTVNGIKYKSSSVTRNMQLTVPFKHQVQVNDKYIAGSTVPVFYNPNKPEKAVLDNAFSNYNYIGLAVSIIFYVTAYYYWE